MNQHAKITSPPIQFIDLAAQRRRLGKRIDDAVARVLTHCQFILGPEVRELERDLSAFCGARHALSCANGTDALALVLMAKGVKAGDAVFCPSFTFCATAEVVAWVGATPVMIDVKEDTFNIDSESLERGIATAKSLGLKPTCLIPVDLFGLPADYDWLLPMAAAHGLFVLSDAAQSFGATYHGRNVGRFGLATSTSFFPAKPLGCYGDGGAVFTDDPELAATMESLRVHGYGTDKYDNVRIGMNGRMDTVQAAILIEKLKIFPDEIVARNRIAERYSEGLHDVCIVPHVPEHLTSVWAQYTIRVRPAQRAPLIAALAKEYIPTAMYYPKPLHRQLAYRGYPIAGNGLPISDRLAEEVLSLPMHPYLEPDVQDRIIDAVRRHLRYL